MAIGRFTQKKTSNAAKVYSAILTYRTAACGSQAQPPVLLSAALHVLGIELSQSIHQGGIVGMGAGRQIRPSTIEIKLCLLLSLQDVLLHGLVDKLLDLVQEASPQHTNKLI